jgi:hypothetical protein
MKGEPLEIIVVIILPFIQTLFRYTTREEFGSINCTLPANTNLFTTDIHLYVFFVQLQELSHVVIRTDFDPNSTDIESISRSVKTVP